MELPGGQADAIDTLAKANPTVVVVLVNNGALSLQPWDEAVPAILAVHYAGQATGTALADVLTGKVNLAGKLSCTFARHLKDYPAHVVGEWPARLIRSEEPTHSGRTPAERKAVHRFDTD
jgi:beta-glucosidase